ncbi:hypothetical protein CON36_36880 [Bacillus cereus]|uniref:Uncharacterized protein n=1 Tax=Bacillus cereus TaxID=1396 RepID=A0A9X6XUK1_BACCE|nr:hypothetical protein [Bacillus cereus]PDZ93872.1 hypothetical protein CON36_36880 [Bacillus cereus]
MSYVIKFIAEDSSDIEGYYTGKIYYYQKESVNVPGHVEEKTHDKVKIYKTNKRAFNMAEKIVERCRFVNSFYIETY